MIEFGTSLYEEKTKFLIKSFRKYKLIKTGFTKSCMRVWLKKTQ